jgi:phosphoadenosine phosphosulfate reductase
MVLLDAAAPADAGVKARADELNRRHGDADADEAIAVALREFPGRIAMVSSFGAESAVLLHLLAGIDRSAPVVFIDTGRLFAETLEYRDTVARTLGLTDVRSIGPDAERIARLDPHKALFMTDPDLCCQIRKTEPLTRALEGFDAWFTGRKRFQAATRAHIDLFEADGARIKVNPIAGWTAERIAGYAAEHRLPQHPLVARGYPSIGCVPCTTAVKPGEDARAGRWRGTDKTECGIHAGMAREGVSSP